MQDFDAILLIAFGGPEQPADIRPFLQRVARGRRIPAERLEEVARHYELVGGRSPLNEITLSQADALHQHLASIGADVPVYVGMRNWHPFFYETLERMAARGHRRVFGIILSAFQTEASWGRYMEEIAEACETLSMRVPVVEYAPPWADHPLFLEAVAERVATALDEVPREFSTPPLVFTAHSVPVSMADASPYEGQFEAASGAVAEALQCTDWRTAYQSRSGRPGDPWLEPDIGEVLDLLAQEGERAVLIVPIGFVCDHVEVLYDLDYEAKVQAQKLGIEFFRAPTINDHPLFIEMLADLAGFGTR